MVSRAQFPKATDACRADPPSATAAFRQSEAPPFEEEPRRNAGAAGDGELLGGS
jgi:hypothetical protein